MAKKSILTRFKRNKPHALDALPAKKPVLKIKMRRAYKDMTQLTKRGLARTIRLTLQLLSWLWSTPRRLPGLYRRAREEYADPQDLRRRLTLSYALVTLVVFMFMWVIFTIIATDDVEEFAGVILLTFLPSLFILGAFMLLFGSLFGYMVSGGLVKRLQSLDEAATAWSDGDFRVQVKDTATDELGQLGRKLNQMAQQLERLMHERVDLAAIEERTFIARELHDAVKQQLFASSMQLSSARTVIAYDATRADEILGDVELVIEQMQMELMALIHMLRPASLQDEGLAIALRGYVATWSQQMGISAEIDTDYLVQLPINIEQALYRVTQEALTNIAKHAEAKQVSITLHQKKCKTILQIKDNGRGFDPNQPQNGFGLKGMQERIEQLAGQLTIKSILSVGTSVTAIVERGEAE